MSIFKKKQTVKTVEYCCEHVQQPWLVNMPWKMQTVLNQGLRAPDTHFCKHIKIVCRWMRGIVLNNADSHHTFMCRKDTLPEIEDIENEINYCSVHFCTHFVYALEIIAYNHPDGAIAKIANNYYRGIVSELLHFNLESPEQLKTRLADVDKHPEIKPCPVNERDDPYLR